MLSASAVPARHDTSAVNNHHFDLEPDLLQYEPFSSFIFPISYLISVVSLKQMMTAARKGACTPFSAINKCSASPTTRTESLNDQTSRSLLYH